jgi:L-glyceraldehyde 3-phosphate reductase
VGVAIYSPLAGGVLTDGNVLGIAPHPLARAADPASEASRAGRHKAQVLRALAHEHGCTLAQLAYRFILADEGVTAAIGGFSERSQMEEIVAVSDATPLSPEAISRLEAIWSANFASSDLTRQTR